MSIIFHFILITYANILVRLHETSGPVLLNSYANFSKVKRIWKILDIRQCEGERNVSHDCFQIGNEGLNYCMCEKITVECRSTQIPARNGLWRKMLRNRVNEDAIKFFDVFWIAAHNAGSDKLRFIPDKHGKFSVSKFGNSECKIAASFSSLKIGRNLARFASKSQLYDISDLLEMGVRFFDIDVCIDNNGELRTCHCLLGRRVSLVLKRIKDWLTLNSDEIVIFRFADGISNNQVYSKLLVELLNHLNAYLIPNNMYNQTLSQLQSNNKRVLAIVRRKVANSANVHYEHSLIRGRYSEHSDVEKVMNDQLLRLRNYISSTLNTLHAYKSPNWKDMVKFALFGETSSNEKSLINQKFVEHIQTAKWNSTMSSVNVIMLNNINRDLVEQLRQFIVNEPTNSNKCL
ncbi:hypothetical protein GJ496_010113 [Pomphorhynchus laevis]|nr:hypothetical protein GJ496_010113 [Pomphorhynchus laevis]